METFCRAQKPPNPFPPSRISRIILALAPPFGACLVRLRFKKKRETRRRIFSAPSEYFFNKPNGVVGDHSFRFDNHHHDQKGAVDFVAPRLDETKEFGHETEHYSTEDRPPENLHAPKDREHDVLHAVHDPEHEWLDKLLKMGEDSPSHPGDKGPRGECLQFDGGEIDAVDFRCRFII